MSNPNSFITSWYTSTSPVRAYSPITTCTTNPGINIIRSYPSSRVKILIIASCTSTTSTIIVYIPIGGLIPRRYRVLYRAFSFCSTVFKFMPLTRSISSRISKRINNCPCSRVSVSYTTSRCNYRNVIISIRIDWSSRTSIIIIVKSKSSSKS